MAIPWWDKYSATRPTGSPLAALTIPNVSTAAGGLGAMSAYGGGYAGAPMPRVTQQTVGGSTAAGGLGGALSAYGGGYTAPSTTIGGGGGGGGGGGAGADGQGVWPSGVMQWMEQASLQREQMALQRALAEMEYAYKEKLRQTQDAQAAKDFALRVGQLELNRQLSTGWVQRQPITGEQMPGQGLTGAAGAQFKPSVNWAQMMGQYSKPGWWQGAGQGAGQGG